jgi:tetratricopeptide (TPR) repeat protein
MTSRYISCRAASVLCLLLLAGCQQEKKMTTDSPEAMRLYGEGVKQGELFYFTEAKQSLEKAIAADSGFALAYGRLGMLAMMTGDQADARKQIAHALRLADRATRFEQLSIRMWSYRIENQFTNVAAVAESLIALYPDEPEPYLMRGQMYEVSKNLEGAVGMYRRSIEVDTGFATGVMSLGYAYSSLGDQEKAVTYMQRYINMAPGAADPYASYADLLLRAGRYDEALEQYQRSLKEKPDYWYAFQQIGRIDIMLGQLKEGRRQVEHAMSLVPPTPVVRSAMVRLDGELALLRGQYPAAVALFEQVLTSDTADYDAARGLGVTLGRLKRFSEAHKLLDRVLSVIEERRLTETDVMIGYLLHRAEVLREEGRYDEALETCTKALDNATPLVRGSVYREIARIRLDAKQWEDAIDAVEQALAVNPNHPATLFTLAKIYGAMGDQKMTQEIGERLLSLWKNADPDFQDCNALLRLLGRKRPA